MKKLSLKTKERNQLVDITQDVISYVSHSGIRDGLVTVYVPHTTAGVAVNENADPSVKKDILDYLSRLIPKDPAFSHSEGNSDSHIKSTLTGTSQTFIIEDGNVLLGTWQGIYFCEFDGPRNRSVFFKVSGK